MAKLQIRFLKLYGWTSLWSQGVLDRRERELHWRVKENFCAVLVSFIWQVSMKGYYRHY